MVRIPLVLLLAAAVPVVAQTPTSADSLRSSLTGTVHDSLGIPVFGASAGSLLIRVPVGTTIDVAIRNTREVPLELHGFATRPSAGSEAVVSHQASAAA